MKERMVSGAQAAAGDELRVELRAEPEASFFEGHFDGDPVLAGVVMLREAELHAREHWGDLSSLTRVTHLKFRRTVRPPADLVLVLRRDAHAVAFEYVTGGDLACSGRLDFAKENAA